MNDFLIPVALILLFWWYISRQKPRTQLSDPNLKEIECKNQYDKLKRAIIECKSAHVLKLIELDVDEFHMEYCNRVNMDYLHNYMRDLDVSIMHQRHKLDDQNSYA